MFFWLWFKAFQRPLRLENGLARGGQKRSISFDMLQNMMIQKVDPKANKHYPTQLPLKTSFLLLINKVLPTLATLHSWLACWLVGWLDWWRWWG